MPQEPMYYGTYLGLDTILDSQHPVSFQNHHQPAHDEMLFIIIHQAYELWFKQILFELDYVTAVFSKEKINDNSEDINLVRHRLHRIIKIFELLNQQVSVLDTMTPLDFLAFRNLLTPSSGFQSKQFRLIEARLGLQLEQRHQAAYYKRTNEGGFTKTDYNNINEVESTKNVQQLINNWLERMPFFDEAFWNNSVHDHFTQHAFWFDYRTIYQAGLTEREAAKLLILIMCYSSNNPKAYLMSNCNS